MDFLNIKDIDYRFVFDVIVHYYKFLIKKMSNIKEGLPVPIIKTWSTPNQATKFRHHIFPDLFYANN
jgi:hypothetical protein